jgi:SAM-dependent methyltransferase
MPALDTPALDRVLGLLDHAPAEPDVRQGVLDLLGEVPEPHDTVAQRFMRSVTLPRVYEQVWRPVIFGLAKGGPLGPSTTEEYALAREWLGLTGGPAATVLDLACGPGNVTRALAEGVNEDGLVVGVDASATMLGRAVTDTRTRNVAYVRCDAVDLPFRTGVFDAVCCYGALYLFEDPWAALAGMARVLRPGGRLVVLTTRSPRLPLVREAMAALSGAVGIRMFTPAQLSKALTSAASPEGGFTAVRHRSYGLMQFAGATRA